MLGEHWPLVPMLWSGTQLLACSTNTMSLNKQASPRLSLSYSGRLWSYCVDILMYEYGLKQTSNEIQGL